MSNVEMYYFGCRSKERGGHYLWQPGWSEVWHDDWRGYKPKGLHLRNFPRTLDGRWAPMDLQGSQRQGLCAMSSFVGWTVVSWWDRSADSRGGCNSILIAQGRYSFNAMLSMARERWPGLLERQPVPLTCPEKWRLFEGPEKGKETWPEVPGGAARIGKGGWDLGTWRAAGLKGGGHTTLEVLRASDGECAVSVVSAAALTVDQARSAAAALLAAADKAQAESSHGANDGSGGVT